MSNVGNSQIKDVDIEDIKLQINEEPPQPKIPEVIDSKDKKSI